MSTESIGEATEGNDLTVRDVAARLRVSRFTIYRLINTGEIAAYRVGRRPWRITRAAVDAYRAANSNQLTAA